MHAVAAMGTVVTVQVVGHDEDAARIAERDAAVARAVAWFTSIEACCSRFEPESELRRVCAQTGVPVTVSPMVFEAVRFAVAVAEETGGAFDPAIGHAMEAAGFDRHFRRGVATPALSPDPRDDAMHEEPRASFRDVALDPAHRTITLVRPLLLDLGAVAKGLAIDMAARELQPLEHFAIEAGGDLYLAGRNQDGAPWAVGVRDPHETGRLMETLHLSDMAVCTSGAYERPSPSDPGAHHLLDARTQRAAAELASATVVAGSAMVADALATAAFVLGPVDGIALLERSGVDGLLVTPARGRITTRRWTTEYHHRHDPGVAGVRPVFPNA